MIDLYLVFFLAGGIVFAGIVWYSMLLQSGRHRTPKEDYVDPLFAELEETKAKEQDAALGVSELSNQDSYADEEMHRVEGSQTAEGSQSAEGSHKTERSFKAEGSRDEFSSEKNEPSLNDEVLSAKSSSESRDSAQLGLESPDRDSLPVIEESALETFKDISSQQDNSQRKHAEPTQRSLASKADESEAAADLPDNAKQVNASQMTPEERVTESKQPEEAKVAAKRLAESALAKKTANVKEHDASAPEPELTKMSKVRARSKSFTQKLAEKVSQRSNARQAKNAVSNKTVEPEVRSAEPSMQAKQAAPVKQPSSTVSGKPKLDKESSSIVTELVARVKNPEPIEQQELLSLFRTHDFKFHRKVHIYGLNQLTDLWRDIEFELPSARFVELGVSIQLADRDGAMTEKELHDFQQMTLEFSNNFDAPFEFSMDIDEALKQAQLLDQIGRRYDSMAVLNVVPKSKSGFRMADIESCARDLMMSADKNGIFMKTKGQKNDISVLYRLACTDGSGHFGLSTGAIGPVHDLVVYMNVPATSDPESVFQGMVKDANSLATWLDGKVVDRTGRSMTQRSYSVLMQQISDIAFSMQQDGLIPGDDISKKLF